MALLEQVGCAGHAMRLAPDVDKLQQLEIEQRRPGFRRFCHCVTQYAHFLQCLYRIGVASYHPT
jgi:hypothetical protein